MVSTLTITTPIRWMYRKTSDTPSDILPELKPDDKSTIEPKQFRCKTCQNPVAFEVDIIQIGDIPSDTAQVNPHGFIHEVITVHHVQNIFITGEPEPADSWFPGFCWRYLICGECTEFLGWSYHRPTEQMMTFAGLSKGQIILP